MRLGVVVGVATFIAVFISCQTIAVLFLRDSQDCTTSRRLADSPATTSAPLPTEQASGAAVAVVGAEGQATQAGAEAPLSVPAPVVVAPPSDVNIMDFRLLCQDRNCQYQQLRPEPTAFPQRFLFVHLPKTGGTAVGWKIQSSNFREVKLMWEAPPSPNEISLDTFARSAIVAHMPFGFHKWWGSDADKFVYVTMLREPVDRVLSHYYYHLQNENDGNHEHTQTRTMLQWMEEMQYANNFMTAYLSGAAPEAWWNLDEFLPGGDPLLIPSGPSPNRAWRITEEHYRRARDNLLTHFRVVGLLERFDESLVLMEHFLGWKGLTFGPMVELNKNFLRPRLQDSPPPDEILEAIRRNNVWDQKLYDLGKELFAEQVRVFGVARLRETLGVKGKEWKLDGMM